MKTWGQFSLDPNYIPLLSVSFYIYFVFALGYVQIIGKYQWVPLQTCPPMLYKKVEGLIMKEQRQAQVEDTIGIWLYSWKKCVTP